MRFAHAHGAGEKQAFAGGAGRIFVDEAPRGEQPLGERGVGSVVDLEGVQRAIAVARGNLRRGEPAALALRLLAAARARNPLALAVHHADEADSIANCADRPGDAHFRIPA